MHFVRSQLVAAQDEADLRAVAVGHDHVPAALDHVGDVLAGLLDCADLRGDVLVLLIQDQGVAADGDDGDLALTVCHGNAHILTSQPIVKAITAFCACRRFSASS